MIIGLDFDNTIVCYDDVFHREAVAQGLVPATVPADKNSVRNYLRDGGREDDWTRLQGHVYGVAIANAQAYPGLREFLRVARAAGAEVHVVSHKTQHPVLGPAHDLHAAGRAWFAGAGLLDSDESPLSASRLHFELTAAAKRQRIAAIGCSVFVDDLPEFLLHPEFPGAVRRIMFDPSGTAAPASLEVARSWADITRALFSGAV